MGYNQNGFFYLENVKLTTDCSLDSRTEKALASPMSFLDAAAVPRVQSPWF